MAPDLCYLLAVFIIFVGMKYKSPDSQGDILPNLLDLKKVKEVNESEFEGFLKAEIYFTEHLSPRTKFNKVFILKIHKMALAHLYSFAGKLRDVNMSKGGFPFAAAKFLRILAPSSSSWSSIGHAGGVLAVQGSSTSFRSCWMRA